MASASSPQTTLELRQRLEALGQALGAREAAHHTALEEARRRAQRIRATVADALAAFAKAAAAAGAPHLAIEVGELRLDDKHVRAIEFDLRRGRHVAIVTVKSRGEVTLVGPFRNGKGEGPCLTFPFDAEAELSKALGDFLERFLEEATAP